jgi:hypothetical protein
MCTGKASEIKDYIIIDNMEMYKKRLVWYECEIN